MAHGDDVRRAVRAAYVHQRQSLPNAVAELGIALSTAQRWKKLALADGDDWDKARAASSLAGDGRAAVATAVLEDYLTQHSAVLAAVGDDPSLTALQRAETLSRLADSFNKVIAAHSKLQPELNRLAVAMEVIQRLSEFIRGRFPQHALAFVELLEPFGDEISTLYG